MNSQYGIQAAAHMSVYPFKPLFMQHSDVRREAEWWEFHRDKTQSIISPLRLFNSLVWHSASFSRNTAFNHFLLSPPGGKWEDLLLSLPRGETKFGLLNFYQCQIFVAPWNTGVEVQRIFSNVLWDVCFIYFLQPFLYLRLTHYFSYFQQ